MRKILILGNNDMGLYRFRKELISELINMNYEVYFSVPNGPYVSKIELGGAVYKQLNFDSAGTNPISELKLLKQYGRLVQEVRPDVVLTYTLKPSLYAGIQCKKYKIAYIINITGISPVILDRKPLGRAVLRIYKGILNRAVTVFFQNRANYELFEKAGVKGNSIIIPGSGVNLTEHRYEDYKKYDKVRILFVGRVVELKGITELLQAIELVQSKRDDVEFRIVGPCDNEYLEKLERMQKEGKLIFYGMQDGVHSFVDECNALILPSHSEGMANVLLEAAASGRPVLASDIPGCRETFEEGLTGFGFEKGNVNSIVRAIIKFCDLSFEAQKQMGIEGRKHVEEKFSRRIIIDKYIEEISKVLGGAE